MMLRKSHSTDTYPSSSTQMDSSTLGDSKQGHIAALQKHLEELRADLTDFSHHFGHWLSDRRRALVDEKQAFQRIIQEDQGNDECNAFTE